MVDGPVLRQEDAYSVRRDGRGPLPRETSRRTGGLSGRPGVAPELSSLIRPRSHGPRLPWPPADVDSPEPGCEPRSAKRRTPLRTAPVALLLAGIACEVFAYWGLSTARGRRAFDEMAGMVPLAAVPTGVVLILLGAVLWWRASWKRG